MDERQAKLLIVGAEGLEKDQIKKYLRDEVAGIQIVSLEELPEEFQKEVEMDTSAPTVREPDTSMYQIYHNLASSAVALEPYKSDIIDETPFYKKIHQKGGKKNKRGRWPR